ncbi:hypothetical protein AVEN_119558-1, partial [Araneus ventricosus]
STFESFLWTSWNCVLEASATPGSWNCKLETSSATKSGTTNWKHHQQLNLELETSSATEPGTNWKHHQQLEDGTGNIISN